MAKFLIACFREGSRHPLPGAEHFRLMSRRLSLGSGEVTPCRPEPLVLTPDSHLSASCLFPASSVRLAKGAICLGAMHGAQLDWDRPGAPVDDGTFALFRSSASAVELVTDAMATRSIWYYFDDDCLIASSSQRLIVMLLGSFNPDPAPVGWMLANGNAGPQGGWDRRIAMLSPATRLLLDRKAWTIDFRPLDPLDERPAGPVPVRAASGDFASRVSAVLQALPIDWRRWRLPLSGGYDSRLLACLIAPLRKIHCLTWDVRVDGSQPNPEVAVAARLAEALGLDHDSIDLPPAEGACEAVLDRFVRASEGLTDSIGGYLDGFALWDRLARDGVDGIVRGDEPFGGAGWTPVADERAVRIGLGLARLDEFPSLRWLHDALPHGQALPARLERRPGEGLTDWRHRLYCDYRVPVALAALTETKTGHVEVINPLQARSVVEFVRELPASLRDDKALLIRTVRAIGPQVPFASIREGDEQARFLRSPDVVRALRAGLDTDDARRIFSSDAVHRLIAGLPGGDGRSVGAGPAGLRLTDRIKASLPAFVKRRLRRFVPIAPMDPCLLAFRAWIVVQINRLLADDAQCLRMAGFVPAKVETAS